MIERAPSPRLTARPGVVIARALCEEIVSIKDDRNKTFSSTQREILGEIEAERRLELDMVARANRKAFTVIIGGYDE